MFYFFPNVSVCTVTGPWNFFTIPLHLKKLNSRLGWLCECPPFQAIGQYEDSLSFQHSNSGFYVQFAIIQYFTHFIESFSWFFNDFISTEWSQLSKRTNPSRHFSQLNIYGFICNSFPLLLRKTVSSSCHMLFRHCYKK